ncbi:MAG: hypothetical protein C5B51_14730 [Terriglobia bacterium]|nr:MAG: hypothetical protein C5B51_14730 [Terriglobia bacterium]
MILNFWTTDPGIRVVIQYVHWLRKKQGIKPTMGRKTEPSCEGAGEFRNLLYCQLLTTPEFEDGWQALCTGGRPDAVIIDGLVRQIECDFPEASRERYGAKTEPELQSIADSLALYRDLHRLLVPPSSL